MPTRSQCSACALMERLKAELVRRRFSCICSDILTIPMVAIRIIWFIYRSYITGNREWLLARPRECACGCRASGEPAWPGPLSDHAPTFPEPGMPGKGLLDQM